MLIKIENNLPVGYPLIEDNFRQLHPSQVFPLVLTSAIVEPYGYGMYDFTDQPEVRWDQKRVEGSPVKDQFGIWRQQWLVVDLTGDDLQAAISELRRQLLQQLVHEYERRMQVIAAGYPSSERESWPVQTSEARALLADAGASTPWIDAAAAARGVPRAELASRIAVKDSAYRVFSGTMSGVRQAKEDAIDAAGVDAQALLAVDLAEGWPA